MRARSGMVAARSLSARDRWPVWALGAIGAAGGGETRVARPIARIALAGGYCNNGARGRRSSWGRRRRLSQSPEPVIRRCHDLAQVQPLFETRRGSSVASEPLKAKSIPQLRGRGCREPPIKSVLIHRTLTCSTPCFFTERPSEL